MLHFGRESVESYQKRLFSAFMSMDRDKNTHNNKILYQEVNRYLRFTWGIIVVFSIIIPIGSILLGRYNYFVDLFSHFQLQYTLWGILLLLIGTFIGIDYRKLLFGTGMILIYFAYILFPVNLNSVNPGDIDKPDIFYMNTQYSNLDTLSIIQQIKSVDPDSVALVEANDEIIAYLRDLYGEPIERNGAGSYSCVIFSRLDHKKIDLYDWRYEYPICATEIMSRKIILIHPHPPLNKVYFEAQYQYFTQIRSLVDGYEELGEKYILLGDFNSTSYNWMYRKHFGDLHQVNIYTWSVGNLNTLPIDHALSNGDIQVMRAPKSSSDHAGLIVSYEH